MRRRTLMLSAAVLAMLAAGGVGYYYWAGGKGEELPPAVPAELVDPPARRAVEKKREVVLANPKSGTGWGELGMAFEAHEQAAEAVTCYRRAAGLDPTDPRWLYLLARQLARGGDSDREEAVRLYRQAADCQPRSSTHRNTVRLTLADLLTELGRGDEAAPLYDQAYSSDPADPWAAYRMGMALSEKGEAERAAAILVGLSNSPYARKKSAIAMAELSRRAGKVKEAEGFDSAANLFPPDARWANPYSAEVGDLRRGRRHLMDRYTAEEAAQDERALVHTATALADQYPSAETQMLLLRALVNAGEYQGAVAVADDLLRTDEGKRLVTAHSFLGLARLGLADQAEAEGRKADADRILAQAADALSESVRLKPDYAPGYLYRAKALLRLGRMKEAEYAARSGIGCRPEEWEGYQTLADVLVATNRKAEAITTLEQAVKLAHPNEPRPRQALQALKK